ncbi:DUF6364 family protein [Mucilaginibacter sp. RB4R14]|uniref:DUF6364 family protein n=1 Tax=Mucilaginibacter aurantiaciroseus TaxID=2949308 RepID=UPI002090DAD3|nr:DUF6364 family protein [Mucilaginibacter aurantiaciroseus]MCO5935644.1 DUF6364 family protein [Mucilaginibacter aurantiaciroseus]
MATAKLTLSMDRDTIQIAKEVAAESNMSVSKFIKTLVIELDKKRKKKKADMSQLADFPEWMQQLIVAREPTPDFDHKALYHKHLDEKYGL